MDKLKVHFNISCISFTWILLFLCLIHKYGITAYNLESIPINVIFQVYFITVLVQVLMFLTNKIPIENTFLYKLIQIVDIFVIVIPLGIYFDFFDFTFKQIFIISIMNISAYIVVSFTILMKNKLDAFYINSKLNKKRSE